MSQFREKNRGNLAQYVYFYVREKIINNEYTPGTPIQEKVIQEELGVSRTPIREAMRKLEHENLIIIYPKRGVFVQEIPFSKVMEIYRIRKLVELYSIDEFFDQIARDDLLKIESQLLKIRDNKPFDEEGALRVGQKFHDLLINSTGNQTLIEIMRSLRADGQRILNIVTKKNWDFSKTLKEHLEIIAAIKDKNRELAKVLLKEHLNDSEGNILR